MTFPYKHTLGKLVDIGQQASLPFYMTSIKLEFPLLLHFSYTVQYKQKYPCIYAERKQVIDILQSTERVFVGLILESVGIIEVTCIWIESELILHQTGQIVLERIDPDVTFISAPYLAVVGLWPETETTTALATSTETSLGPETTNAVKTTETTNGSTEETTADTSTAMSDQSTATEPVTTDQLMSSMESSTVSYDQMSTSRTSTMVSGQTNVSRSTCFCRCTNFSNMTREELLRRKEALRRELGVNVTQLSSYIRKFISVPDNRPSAAGVGAVGVMILALVICTIMILDLTTLRKRKK
ncbi:uncharacterized protein [Argopecten irradians]|uniref:uncharacterized protein n=1 Tax=Argopecten irradians TaxID=31199 RepID=UPI0037148913